MSQSDTPTTPEALVAWQVEVDTYRSIVFAATKPKARWVAVKAYWEAGYGRGPGTWPPVSAWRVARHDNSPLRNQGPKCWTPSYVEEMRP